MNANKILIALLFLIAFILLTVALLYPTFIDTEVEPIGEPLDVTPAPQPETEDEAEMTIWTTSREHFTVMAPANWELLQRDSGGLSTIAIAEENGFGSKQTPDTEIQISLGLSSSFEGQPISLDAWVNEQLIDADKIESCDASSFGTEPAQCFIVTTRGETQKEYFGTSDTLTYFKVVVGLEPIPEISAVLASLNFNPSEEDLVEAEIIP